MRDISVVMGVYNGAATLGATLDSVLTQEDADIELIVVDDGSTDGSATLLDDCAARDPRVRVLHQPNLGLTRALVAGCAAARGRYIARQDAGDLSHPRRLVTQQRMLDADPEVVFVSCATEYVAPEGEPLWIAHPTGVALTPASILDPAKAGSLSDGPTHHGSVMFRRDAYERAGGYRAAFYYGQDFDLWYRLAALGRFQTVDEVLYTARITPDSISGSARPQQERLAELSRTASGARLRGESEDTLLAAAALIGPSPATSWCRRARGLYFVGETLRRNGNRRGRKYLWSAARHCPFLVQAWIRLIQSLIS
jgi:glycosyltransferase involved in cell wall biosynthesis